MNYGRVLKWGALTGAGAAIAVVAGCVYQVRNPPVANGWYVALGSSYAAGLGMGPRAPGSPVVSQRSINGYPQQLARLLKVPSFTDMTSSGATVRHVLHGGQMMLGPQIDALGADTRLVTLTAGGNDVGYVGDLIAMASGKGVEPATARDFATLEGSLRATLREIRERSPKARIVVVTYPAILPDRGTCPSVGITEEQAAPMRAVAEKLARTTRAAAAGAGATIVDMAALSRGHNACGKVPWVNGFKPGTGAGFHPTRAGAQATAQTIGRVIGRVSPKAATDPD